MPGMRIRKPDGETEAVPPGRFLEITDNAGNPIEALFFSSNNSIVRLSHLSGKKKEDYEKLFGVRFVDTFIDHSVLGDTE